MTKTATDLNAATPENAAAARLYRVVCLKNNNISVRRTSDLLYYSDFTNVSGASDKSECYHPHLSFDVALGVESKEIASLTSFVRNDADYGCCPAVRQITNKFKQQFADSLIIIPASVTARSETTKFTCRMVGRQSRGCTISHAMTKAASNLNAAPENAPPDQAGTGARLYRVVCLKNNNISVLRTSDLFYYSNSTNISPLPINRNVTIRGYRRNVTFVVKSKEIASLTSFVRNDADYGCCLAVRQITNKFEQQFADSLIIIPASVTARSETTKFTCRMVGRQSQGCTISHGMTGFAIDNINNTTNKEKIWLLVRLPRKTAVSDESPGDAAITISQSRGITRGPSEVINRRLPRPLPRRGESRFSGKEGRSKIWRAAYEVI